MKTFILWFAPLVIGALIGYVTNAVAIKMLFRPLKPVKIFGIRLPFTPGILPRERHKLADSIGSMVERKLLTPEILKERLKREDVRAGVHISVANNTGKILESPLGVLLTGKSENPPFIMPILRDFLRSPAFDSLLDSFLTVLAGYAENLKITLGELLGEKHTGILREKLDGVIRETFKSQASRIAHYAGSALDSAFPQVIRQFALFLNKSEIHHELEIQGRIFLNNAILKLSILQRFFISAGQYDKTLSERMPEIIDDLIEQLETLLSDAGIRKRLTTFAEETVYNMASRELLPETVTQIVSSMVLSYINMPLGEMVKKLNPDGPGNLNLRIRDFFKQTGGPKFKELVRREADRFLKIHGDTVCADFFLIDSSKKEKINAYIGDKILRIAGSQVEEVLRTINIKTLVSERIDSLDMIEVEHIVLDVMANQLKWINIFGAILGAFIGGSQVLLTWFTR
jgi:uncharacterized membrane protein YheB (UPF0754 family)